MTTVLLVRHGRTKANTQRILAGRTEVELDEVGQQQAQSLADRLRGVKLAAIVTSPLLRCRQTVQTLAGSGVEPVVEERLNECEYGQWSNKPLAELAEDPLWPVVQWQSSAVRFPGGEAMSDMAARAVSAVHDWSRAIALDHGEQAVWLLCSHEDVIKAILASLLGMHLDHFQRITVVNAAPAVVRLTRERPYLLRLNDTAGDLNQLLSLARS